MALGVLSGAEACPAVGWGPGPGVAPSHDHGWGPGPGLAPSPDHGLGPGVAPSPDHGLDQSSRTPSGRWDPLGADCGGESRRRRREEAKGGGGPSEGGGRIRPAGLRAGRQRIARLIREVAVAVAVAVVLRACVLE